MLIYLSALALSIGYILLICRIARYLGIAYGPLPKIEVRQDGYWCVVCGRFLPSQDGVIVHDQVPHPPLMTFDEEDRPQ